MKEVRLRIQLVLEPGTDGVFRHVEGLGRHLLAHGHQVDLAYSSVRGSDRLQAIPALAIGIGLLVQSLWRWRRRRRALLAALRDPSR